MACLNGFRLKNVSCEEYIVDTEFIFGELWHDKPVGSFVRRRNIPAYGQYAQYVPEYMSLNIAETSFEWDTETDRNTIYRMCAEAVSGLSGGRNGKICMLIDCLFNLDAIECVWAKNGNMPIQCVWNHKAYRIYGLNGTDPFSPFDNMIQKAAEAFAADFGNACVSWFEDEDDFELSVKRAKPGSDTIQFVC